MTYDCKKFFLWLNSKKPLKIRKDIWKESYGEVIDAFYARFKGWE